MTIPENMVIRHQRDYVPGEGYSQSRFFRLRHDLKRIPEVCVPGLEVRTAQEQDYEAVLDIIRASYPGIRVDRAWLKGLAQSPAYAPELWLLALVDGVPAGCVITDYDPQAREGILEWVQVLPGFRRRGLGKALVCEALRRMRAEFATVSGNADNETSPEALYRSCGFTGGDVWYIMQKL